MADNVTLPGTGAVISTDDIGGGVEVQRVKVQYGADGSATDVSASNPLPATVDSGTLMQRIELLEMVLGRLLSGAGGQPHDGQGRTRVSVDAIGSVTLGTVTTVTTVSKVSQLGAFGVDPEQMVVSQSNMAALALRDRITVS